MAVSPASRAVVLVAKAINIELDLREIDISRGEHMTPEFLKVRNNIPNTNLRFVPYDARMSCCKYSA